MTSSEKPISLTLQPNSGQNLDAEELDALTRQLLSEIGELEVESAQLARGQDAPGGTKGADPVALGALAVSVLPPMLPKLIDFLQSWSLRGESRTVKIKAQAGDRQIEVEYSPTSMSAADLKKLVNTLIDALPPADKEKRQ